MLGSLDATTADSHENVAWKVNSHFFSLHHDYSNSLTFQMQANSSKFIEEKKILSCCLFTSLTKRENRHFHVVVVQWRQRNVQKSVMHVQSCCFALSSYCFFNTFSSPLHRYTLFHYLRYIVMRQKQNFLSANWIAAADRIRNRLFDSSVAPSFLVRKAWWTNRATVAK